MASSQSVREVHPRDQYNCPVCHENVRWRFPVVTFCGHVFCGNCIVCCLLNQPVRCPVCNQELEPPFMTIICLIPQEFPRPTEMVRRCGYRPLPIEVYDDPIQARLINGVMKNTEDVKDTEHYKCPKCKVDAIHNKPTTTSCGHVFCEKCLMGVSECPHCQRKIQKNSLIRLYL